MFIRSQLTIVCLKDTTSPATHFCYFVMDLRSISAEERARHTATFMSMRPQGDSIPSKYPQPCSMSLPFLCSSNSLSTSHTMNHSVFITLVSWIRQRTHTLLNTRRVGALEHRRCTFVMCHLLNCPYSFSVFPLSPQTFIVVRPSTRA